MRKITLSPITRISGLLTIDVFVDNDGPICEANCSGEQFRGFELMMKGRKVTDSVYFTQRVCGICSMAHGYTAARLVKQIYGTELSREAVLLQQAMLGAEFLQNHIRHFYLLVLPDYLDSTLLPNGTGLCRDVRFTGDQQRLLIQHYYSAMEFSRKCHEMLAVFGGKIPHQHGLVAQGVAVEPTADRRMQFLALLKEIREFMEGCMMPDTYLLAQTYPDYFSVGLRPHRFLSFGLFDPELGGHFPAGVCDEGRLEPVNLPEIRESIAFAWFRPSEGGETIPDADKPGAYSWVKAPRYKGCPYEGGPLARKVLLGLTVGTGTMDRIVARTEEAVLIGRWIKEWIMALPEQGSYIVELGQPVLGRAVQVNDAPRGALLHAIAAQGEEVQSYVIITPTTWNFSPKDEFDQRGPAEEALVGTNGREDSLSVQVGRIVRAFDPCLSCGAHIINPKGERLMQINIQA